MARPPDQINERTTTFNESGQLWNDNQSNLTKSFSYLRQVFDETQLPNIAPDATRPKVLTDFSAIESDVSSSSVTSDTTDDVPRTPIYGSFAAVRALRLLHQHRIGFWGESGIVETISARNGTDPSSADIQNKYQTFLLFSYLPDELTPTQEEFGDLITPSKMPANIRNALPNMGITVVTTSRDPEFAGANGDITTILPDPHPFADNLSSFCTRP